MLTYTSPFPFALSKLSFSFPNSAKKCNNAQTPDRYGHYREAKFTATKHHWWYKANFVFDRLPITRDYQGPVVLLEEDHYVSPDLVNAVHELAVLRDRVCSDCAVLSLASYAAPSFAGAHLAHATAWLSTEHNMAMSFDRRLWTQLKQCNEAFCSFDDYNWDWTLQHLGERCLGFRLKALALDTPRAFHLGTCSGMHHDEEHRRRMGSRAPPKCDPFARYDSVRTLLKDHAETLRSASSNPFEVSSRRASLTPRTVTPNGGWGDPRDHNLCMSFVHQ